MSVTDAYQTSSLEGALYNEALHRFINPHFTHAGRIGLPLAYALLTILLHIHNCKKEDSFSHTIAMKLGCYAFSTPSNYGLVPKDRDAATSINDRENEGELIVIRHNSTLSFPEDLIARVYRNAFLSNETIKNIRRIPGSYIYYITIASYTIYVQRTITVLPWNKLWGSCQ